MKNLSLSPYIKWLITLTSAYMKQILHSRTGVSSSYKYKGRIWTKMELAGRIKTENVSTGCKRGLKWPLFHKNHNFNYNMRTFDDDAGHTNTSGGPHAAHGPRD